MPRTGRPRKPTATKKAQGTFRKSRALKDEWMPPVGAPERPKTLTGVARAEWERVVPLLVEARVLTLADRSALEEYCEAYKLWHVYKEIAEAEPMVEGSRRGDPPKVNPAAKLALQAMETANRLRSNFGLNPSARSKVPVDPKKKTEDPAAKFLFGKGDLEVIAGGKSTPGEDEIAPDAAAPA